MQGIAPARAGKAPGRGLLAARGLALAWSVGVAALFAGLYAWALFQRHARYDTYAFDLGLLAQVAWNNLHGRWFETTVMPFNYLAEHLSPALVVISPVFLLWRDVEALLCLQSLAVASAGVGIYLAARRLIGDAVAALLVQLAYHLAPAVGWVARDEFHPIALAMPVVAFATALLWRGRFWLAALVAGLALLANEDAALWVAPFGLLIAAVGRRRGLVPGSLLALVGVGWLATYMVAIVPAVRPPELGETVPHPNVGAFSQCGDDLAEVARCLLGDPAATLRRATTEGDREALASIFLPTAGLGLLGPSTLASIGRWLVLLLGNDPPYYQAHYVALLVPAAYLGAAETIGWLSRARLRPALPHTLGLLVVVASLVGYLRASPLPGGQPYPMLVSFAETPARAAVIDEAVRLIPDGESVAVAATSSILPRLALRPRIYLMFEGPNPPPDYRIVDERNHYPVTHDVIERHVALLRADPKWQTIFERDDVLVFKRQRVPPDRPADAVFGGSIRLLGYTIEPMGDRALIELHWEARAPLARDYHYFVHLKEGDQGFSQQDGELAGGHLPATQWAPGQAVRERIVLPAPPVERWGDYHLCLGWYDLESGERLKLPDGGDNVVLPLAATRP